MEPQNLDLTAVGLLNHFQSVEAVMTAPEKESIKIRGLGKKKAKKIREVLMAVRDV